MAKYQKHVNKYLLNIMVLPFMHFLILILFSKIFLRLQLELLIHLDVHTYKLEYNI